MYVFNLRAKFKKEQISAYVTNIVLYVIRIYVQSTYVFHVLYRAYQHQFVKTRFRRIDQIEIGAFLVFGLFHLSLQSKVHQSP